MQEIEYGTREWLHKMISGYKQLRHTLEHQKFFRTWTIFSISLHPRLPTEAPYPLEKLHKILHHSYKAQDLMVLGLEAQKF